ncbi:MAG TPA: hypothetical protein VEQ87_00985 [Burkholderiales bacterium]|nr:hypothetical protein [Burkholderiales bacterium]
MRAACIAAALISLAGCAAIGRQQAADSEQLLDAAGFRQLPANTAAREEGLKELRPRQLFARAWGDETRYVFADPDNCRCLYVGGEKEYAQLQRLRQARIDEHDRLVKADESDRTLNADLWGPWKPEGLDAQ